MTASPTMHFPYAQPYAIQLDLMSHVYSAIARQSHTVVESPTGTGKTLTLICSSLSALRDDKTLKRSQIEQQVRRECTGQDDEQDELDWVIEHEVKVRLDELDDADRKVEQRLSEVRLKEEQDQRSGRQRYTKRRKTADELADGKDRKAIEMDQFAPEPYLETPEDAQKVQHDGIDNFSPAVRAMMDKLYGKPAVKEEQMPDTPKVLFASRTHSQLSQFVAELQKTAFSKTFDQLSLEGSADAVDDKWRPVRLIPLGSRQNLCINDDVRRKSGGSNEAMGDICLELQKNGGKDGSKRCTFLPPADDASRLNEFRDKALASVKDIDDIEDLGRQTHTCPYYGSRHAVRSAEIVTLPYSMLLSKTTRESLDISLQDNIVVIDEAHNLIDSILQLHSVSINLSMLTSTRSALLNYIAKFKSRLTGANASNLKQFALVLRGLSEFATKWPTEGTGLDKWGKKEQLVSVNKILQSKNAGALDQINLLKLDTYLRQSRIARKIGGYTEAIAEEKTAAGEFLLASLRFTLTVSICEYPQVVTNAEVDGRVLLSAETVKSTPLSISGTNGSKMGESASTKVEVTLKYMLLSPAESFREVIDQAKSVILAGGTMSPMSDFREQLFPSVPADKFSAFSCGHVVAEDHVATFALDDLGQSLINIAQRIPMGVVVFVPSYDFLNGVQARWTKTGLLSRLSSKKQVFWEPKQSNEVESVLSGYATANMSGKQGGIMFAVVGAKLSEGINFADDMARGIPYPNSQSVELKERMAYLRATGSKTGIDPGQVFYNNLAFRAVNQSIGRAIRNVNDWAAIILLDERYTHPSKRSQLPSWLVGRHPSTPTSRTLPSTTTTTMTTTMTTTTSNATTASSDRVQVVQQFGQLVRGLDDFVKSRRMAQSD
ncbi:ATP-dependent DNA helicase chl1 [Microbotryomycetes sp. JL201]|nr:ATP-dependent DNA helicase chl1 [Microbotryomycetes sp. JL201]